MRNIPRSLIKIRMYLRLKRVSKKDHIVQTTHIAKDKWWRGCLRTST